ncbi:MAG: iron-containing redox enzyme family protein [Collimonas pratensis]|uniref:iron-containing redox enzyme family protein n=1 Tax=Collimonas pratensis TaxID=279113 RepID=UPI003C77C991
MTTGQQDVDTQTLASNPDFQLIKTLFNYPRLRENLWQVQADSPHSYVETLDSEYQVPTDQALAFLPIRSHCTGYNSLAEIEQRSGVPETDVLSILLCLAQAGITLPGKALSAAPDVTPELVRDKLQRISAIWSRELSREFVANELLGGDLPKTVLLGWLLEMYHYVRDFPQAIAHGAACASGELQHLLARYAAEETGHENFVLQTLVNLGLKEEEVKESRPLVSTRLIAFLLRELFELEPAAVLLVAAVVEAQDVPADKLDEFQARLEYRHALPAGAMKPYFQHQAIDASLGHSQLLAENIKLFQVHDIETLDKIVDKLHDLKHAFELQSQEIKMYYGELTGKYFPRQAVTFSTL